MTLRDVTHKKCKTLVGVAWWLFLSLTPVRSFPPLTTRLSLPFNIRDRGLRSWGISEHLQLSTGPGWVHPSQAHARAVLGFRGGHSPPPKAPPFACYILIGLSQIFILHRPGSLFSAFLIACAVLNK